MLLICKNDKPLPGNDVNPPLEIGKEYETEEIYVCDNKLPNGEICGQEHYHVGLKSYYSYISCYKCKTSLPDGTKKHWCHPSRFDIKSE